jgi:putative ABC transport system substrate-binding protein
LRWKSIIILVFVILVVSFLITDKPENLHNGQKPHLIGVLASNDLRMAKVEGLKAGLHDLGFREDKDLQFIVKNAESKRENLLPLARELKEAGVKVIVTTGRVETEVIKRVTRGTDIPIVFMGLTALTQDNLVKNLLHPQEGLTGIQNDHATLSGKRLELLTKLLPNLNKVLVVYDPKVVPALESLYSTQIAAQMLEIDLEIVTVSTISEIKEMFSGNLEGISAVLLLPSFFLESEGARVLVPLAKERGLPVMGVEHGTDVDLFAIYGITPYDQGRQAARILAKILEGQKVEDIPVEPPAELKLTVNLGVVKELELQIEPSFLNCAEIIYPREDDKDAK